ATAPAAPVARRADRKRVVVIDPGHGGADSGAVSARGLVEKDLALSYAQELRSRLVETGRYHVVLTRERDVFLRLRERIAIARAAEADLFISLHADSIADRALRGGSVYTLSENALDEEAAALAAKENKADLIAGVDLSGQRREVVNILIDLAQRKTKDESTRLARRLIDELSDGHLMLRKSHRSAGFAVLKAPDVPAVLFEMGYLSNAEDEAILSSVAGRDGILGAVVRAIDRFFEVGPAIAQP
ncbi:MAG: N-acetylmuramoyl-L-alanine amidase, partial [Alphaproteobacteria bacterium]|nr:N-acetylmuramoyl-L-alanine amidase [Alphaproteobacteria bacterium]